MSILNYINDSYAMSDTALLKQLAEFIRQTRLKKNYTQGELAARSGIHRVSISEFENGGRNISLLTFIEMLRALNELELLETFKVQTSISPLQMARLEAQKRQRASRKHTKTIDKKRASNKKKK